MDLELRGRPVGQRSCIDRERSRGRWSRERGQGLEMRRIRQIESVDEGLPIVRPARSAINSGELRTTDSSREADPSPGGRCREAAAAPGRTYRGRAARRGTLAGDDRVRVDPRRRRGSPRYRADASNGSTADRASAIAAYEVQFQDQEMPAPIEMTPRAAAASRREAARTDRAAPAPSWARAEAERACRSAEGAEAAALASRGSAASVPALHRQRRSARRASRMLWYGIGGIMY